MYKERAKREWEKIKDHNIFDDFDTFYEFFLKQPVGRCFKKYTRYEWSKDNFYFGSYGGLQNYLKTTTDIPFYLEEKKGNRYFNFVVKDFFRDKANILFANCICDCGKEFSREWVKILDRKIHSCGCRKGKGVSDSKPKKKTLVDFAKDIVEKYWDYDKNEIMPEEVFLGDEGEYWWKGECGSYLMPASICMQRKGGTSFPEQAILFYLKKYGLSVEHRKKISANDKKYEVDIYLPQVNVAIEYDGFFWHKEKSKYEKEKNQACIDNDIFLIRIREKGLRKTGVKKGVEILCGDTDEEIMPEIITKIFYELNKIDSNIIPINIDKEMFLKSIAEIYSNYAGGFIEDNISSSWLIRFWAEENGIPPYLLSKKTNKKFWFKCSSNKILISPRRLIEIAENPYYYGKQKVKFFKENLRLLKRSCPFSFNESCPANTYVKIDDYIFCQYREKKYKPYAVFVKDYKKLFLSSITLNKFEETYKEFMRYKGVQEETFFLDFFDGATKLTDKEKFDYFNSIITSKAYAGWNDLFIDIFSNEKIANFYIENYDYKILFRNLPLENLLVSPNRKNESNNIYLIFAITLKPPYKDKYIIATEKMEKFFSLLLDKISVKIKNKMNFFIRQLFDVVYLHMLLRGVRLSSDLQGYQWFINLLFKYIGNDVREEIESILKNKDYEKKFFEKELPIFVSKEGDTKETLWQFEEIIKQI